MTRSSVLNLDNLKIFDMLSHLDISKAAGSDGISASYTMLKAISISATIIAYIPDQWKKPLVVPIPKSSDSSNTAVA